MSRMTAGVQSPVAPLAGSSSPQPAAGSQAQLVPAHDNQHTATSAPSSTSAHRSSSAGKQRKPLPASRLGALSAAAAVLIGAGLWAALALVRRGPKPTETGDDQKPKKGKGPVKGPCSGMKNTSKSVPLADGSACVIRRAIPADNSCLFNAVGYVMHHSKQKANFLRSVVAREVSSDPTEYSDVFLGMSNVAYCSWIMNRANWGGGIELSILAKHYGREISAWNIESASQLVFGEEAGYQRQVLLIYNGVHYDALAISPGPRAPESEDVTEFNPRTKRGKMIIAAAQKLVQLTHKGKKFVAGTKFSTKLRCSDCKEVFSSQKDSTQHAVTTGHVNFEQVK